MKASTDTNETHINMFSGLLQEHAKKVAEERTKIEKNRASATVLASKLSDALVDSVNRGVAEVSERMLESTFPGKKTGRFGI